MQRLINCLLLLILIHLSPASCVESYQLAKLREFLSQEHWQTNRRFCCLMSHTSSLDPISTQHVEDILTKLKTDEGMTIEMISHSIKQIQRIAGVVCLIVNGEIVEILQPQQLSS